MSARIAETTSACSELEASLERLLQRRAVRLYKLFLISLSDATTPGYPDL
jgi:hypothetical protein